MPGRQVSSSKPSIAELLHDDHEHPKVRTRSGFFYLAFKYGDGCAGRVSHPLLGAQCAPMPRGGLSHSSPKTNHLSNH